MALCKSSNVYLLLARIRGHMQFHKTNTSTVCWCLIAAAFMDLQHIYVAYKMQWALTNFRTQEVE